MAIADDFQVFLDSLLAATQDISQEYFRLPIVDDGFQYRERVYCYELYHQLRLKLPNDFLYKLGGEVDKSGHPIISKQCGDIIPDFLAHSPGFMGPGDNLAILEVKPIGQAAIGKNGKLLSDIKKLQCMTSIENGYYRGIILIFGNGHDGFKTLIQHYFQEHCNPDQILLLFHHQAGQPAEIVNY